MNTTNIAVKQWGRMVRLWKLNHLDSPLNELFTYSNYMCDGHYSYFMRFKNTHSFNQHLDVLKEFLPEVHINNLIAAKKVFDSYEDKRVLKEIEETVFEQYDVIYFQDVAFVERIIFDLLYNGEQIVFQKSRLYKLYRVTKGRQYIKKKKKQIN